MVRDNFNVFTVLDLRDEARQRELTSQSSQGIVQCSCTAIDISFHLEYKYDHQGGASASVSSRSQSEQSTRAGTGKLVSRADIYFPYAVPVLTF